MTRPRSRWRCACACATAAAARSGWSSVIVIVGALFPAVGDTIGKLNLPEGVAELLGGADYATLTGWFRSEIGAVYGPLVIAALAITAAAGLTAGEEEAGDPRARARASGRRRSRLVLAKAAAIAAPSSSSPWACGRPAARRRARGRRHRRRRHGRARRAPGLLRPRRSARWPWRWPPVPGARRSPSAARAAFALLGFLINGFAPLVTALAWLKYLSPFYYYAGHDPITHGVDLGDLAVLAGATILLTVFAALAIGRRDLRG